jgi:predicted RecB family nuclease
MRLLAFDITALYRPTPCEGRVWLRAHNVPEAEPSDYEKVLQELGKRHEARHLATLGPHVDLSGVRLLERLGRTADAIVEEAAVIYQPAFSAKVVLNGERVEVVGLPDFLIRKDGGYAIRDSKLSRRINDNDHPEILLQVQLYGWLLRQTTGTRAHSLEVHSGTGDIVAVPDDGGKAALETLGRITALRQMTAEPDEPVGWSKCSGCGFFDRCRKAAEARNDVALVMDVDQGLARALHGIGVRTPQELLTTFSPEKLAGFKRPCGKREQRVGKAADRILQLAEVAISRQERVLAKPDIPADRNWVMLDLEGIPPHLDEDGKIYPWGLQVFGAKPTQYMAATTDFGPDGDRQGWFRFLQACGELFETYGDIRYVHWAPYERTNITHGDKDGTAARVKDSLLDLLTVARESILLPLPSFSLKVVEKYIRFQRTQKEYGGDWSMAKFIEATETEDAALRQQVMDELLLYNREDLEAMWAVFEWMKGKRPAARATATG